MEIYLVGGALRDDLLGLPVQDRDFVVVGTTVEAMVAQGFKPVGQSFPVFLHPHTHEEHALARTERKDGHGYKGFFFHAAPTVTLEEDLARRDITINAMAKNLDTGEVVDPFGGQRDLKEKILRHVSPAFVEDPVRVLRVARFAARFADFHVAGETLALMKQLTKSGELDHLVYERVWQEISRGLMESAPQRMIEVLQVCGAWPILLGLSPPMHTAELAAALMRAAEASFSLPVRYTLLVFYSATSREQVMHLNSRLTAPTDCASLALMFMRQHQALAQANTLTAEELNTLFERCDILRRPERLTYALEALVCVEPTQSARVQWIKDAAQVLRQMDIAPIVANAKDKDVGEKIKRARIAALLKFKG